MTVTDDTLEAVWAWLPARPDRRRAVHPAIAAAELGLSVIDVATALQRLAATGRVANSRRGQPYRTSPIGGRGCSSSRHG